MRRRLSHGNRVMNQNIEQINLLIYFRYYQLISIIRNGTYLSLSLIYKKNSIFISIYSLIYDFDQIRPCILFFFSPDFKTHMLYDKKIIFLNLKAYASLKAMLFTYLTFNALNSLFSCLFINFYSSPFKLPLKVPWLNYFRKWEKHLFKIKDFNFWELLKTVIKVEFNYKHSF